MFPSIFTDELGLDIAEALPIIRGWGLEHCDLRGRVMGKAFEALSPEGLGQVKALLAQHGMQVGCLQSSLAKVHLPGEERQQTEAAKLESVIRAADVLGCRLVRAFFYWQPPAELAGELAVRPDEQQKVLDMFGPLAERAKAVGLTLAFENCGVTTDEVLTVVDALGMPSWGLAWDVHNGWSDPARAADQDAYLRQLALRSRLVHVKARGAVADLGGDVIPYDKVLQVCDNAGVQGPVSAETHNPDRSVSNTDMSERVVQVIKKAWPTAAPGGLFDTRKAGAAVERSYIDDPVGFVVVGLGMGHNRAKMITTTPGVELIGVCDIREERAQRTSEACEVPYTTDVRLWLERDDVEAVFVMTETGRHGEIALQALEAGKHVMTTKPMDASLAACDAMIRLAEERDRLLAVDFSRRYESGVQTLHAAVRQGRFGELLGAEASLKILRTMDYFNANGGWRGTRRWDGGGVLSNQSIHHIDELAFCLGIPEKVRCTIWTQTHEIEAEDVGCATWLYGNGLALTYYGTSSYPHPTWYFRLEIHGTEGAFSKAAGGPFEKPVERWFADGAWGDRAPEMVECEWLNAVDNFAAAIRTGADLVCSGRDGRRTQAVLDAMYRSAYDNAGGWVDVEPELE